MKCVAGLAALLAAACLVAAQGASAGPPAGLTSSGRLLWNLEALLHDTFGNRDVYVNYTAGGPGIAQRGNFSATYVGDAGSEYFIYTFVGARHSSFRPRRPATSPKPVVGAAGGESPLTIRGAYISCARNKWLYEHWGNGPKNWQIDCLRAPG
jgi:hypothetical protein